jgi:putative ABC transport system substrate-binding protein
LQQQRSRATTRRQAGQLMPVRSDDEIKEAVRALAEKPNSGFVGLNDSFNIEHRKTIIEAANRHHLPAIFQFLLFPADGGLMSYGIDSVEIFPRAAGYIDRILRGEKPGDLPVQQPSKFTLVHCSARFREQSAPTWRVGTVVRLWRTFICVSV